MIRRVEETDRLQYVTLAHAFYDSDAVAHPIPKAHIEAAFEEMLHSDVYLEGYILQHENVVAGYALISKTFSCEGGGLTLWVEELYVLPQYRSRGLGRALLATLEAIHGRTLARIRLEISPDNRRAQALYEQLGFQILPYRQMVKEFSQKISD